MKTPVFNQERSDELQAQLEHMANMDAVGARSAKTSSWPRRVRRNTAWGLTATMIVALTATAAIQQSASSAQATEILHGLSSIAKNYSDVVPDKNEFLKVETHGFWLACTAADDGSEHCVPDEERVINFYKPGNAKAQWAFEYIAHGSPNDVQRAVDGAFESGDFSWLNTMLKQATSGQTLYDYVDSTYSGGSLSRDENNFVRLTDALRTGLVPAAQRGAFYDALSKVPGVTATKDVTTKDGRVGVSIGRTEPLRMGMREELIVDPGTGQIIGSRDISTAAILGFGKNEVTGQSYIKYSKVDSAPESTRTSTHPDQEEGEINP